jgi:HSP20 family protein
MNKLVNYNPLGVNKFFDDFFNRDLTDFFGTDGNFSQPSVNVVETEKAFRIEVAAPGLDKNDFNLEVDRNSLVISAKKEASNEVKEEKFMRREFNYTAFTRSFQLPEGVNADEIGAQYSNGVLHVTLPKREDAQAAPVKRIEIN